MNDDTTKKVMQTTWRLGGVSRAPVAIKEIASQTGVPQEQVEEVIAHYVDKNKLKYVNDGLVTYSDDEKLRLIGEYTRRRIRLRNRWKDGLPNPAHSVRYYKYLEGLSFGELCTLPLRELLRTQGQLGALARKAEKELAVLRALAPCNDAELQHFYVFMVEERKDTIIFCGKQSARLRGARSQSGCVNLSERITSLPGKDEEGAWK